MVVLAFEPGIAGLFALLYPPEEVLKGRIQIPQRSLQSSSIYFPQPFQWLLELGQISGTAIVVESLAVLLIDRFPLSKIVVPDKTTATKGLVYLLCLCLIGIDAEFIAIFHLHTSHFFLIFDVLFDDRQRSYANGGYEVGICPQ